MKAVNRHKEVSNELFNSTVNKFLYKKYGDAVEVAEEEVDERLPG